MKCCICGKEIKMKNSNSAEPLEKGRCCDKCNLEFVIPYRLSISLSYLNEKKGDENK